MNNEPFDVFEPYPGSVIHEANILLRVKNTTALDYEKITSYTFKVQRHLIYCNMVHSSYLIHTGGVGICIPLLIFNVKHVTFLHIY